MEVPRPPAEGEQPECVGVIYVKYTEVRRQDPVLTDITVLI